MFKANHSILLENTSVEKQNKIQGRKRRLKIEEFCTIFEAGKTNCTTIHIGHRFFFIGHKFCGFLQASGFSPVDSSCNGWRNLKARVLSPMKTHLLIRIISAKDFKIYRHNEMHATQEASQSDT